MQYSKYLSIARQNEKIFKAILQDLREHKQERPLGCLIPLNLDAESTIEEIYEKYSLGNREILPAPSS